MRWTCSVGLVYALIAALYSKPNSFRTFFRMLWTMALASGIATALFTTPLLQMHVSRISLGGVIEVAITFDRAVSALVGLALVALVGFGFLCPVRAAANVQVVSIIAAVIFGAQLVTVIALILNDGGIFLLYKIETVLWIACLVYLLLFLSTRGEAGHSDELSGN